MVPAPSPAAPSMSVTSLHVRISSLLTLILIFHYTRSSIHVLTPQTLCFSMVNVFTVVLNLYIINVLLSHISVFILTAFLIVIL